VPTATSSADRSDPARPATRGWRPSLPLAAGSKPPRHLADLDPAERRAAVAALGEQPFRAEQLSRHYFTRLTSDAAAMTDLPGATRERLAADLLPDLLAPVRTVTCDAGETRKTLWRGHDGVLVESVLMRYPGRTTVCVSSQAGCGMGCPFCATGQGGLQRNLSTGEIVEQVVAAQRVLASGELPPDAGDAGYTADAAGTADAGYTADAAPTDHVSNVVFMGMGEPLANYRAVVAAVRRLTDPAPHGLGLPQRTVTVSTVGLVPAIAKLGAEGLSVRLALSLHAPDDELRDTLVPVNQRWPVKQVLRAAFGYAESTGRRLSIEYALIDGVNDQPERADRLARLVRGRLVHVNLIPLNPTPGTSWQASAPQGQREFVHRLRAAGVPTTVRDTRGREIAGACGQLAAVG